jgi:2'-5' RNA ligase
VPSEQTNGNGASRIILTDALPPSAPTSFRSAEEFRAATSILLDRAQFMRLAGVTFGTKRDTYEVLGYQRQLTTKDYHDRYARGGIAGAVVDALPKATWRSDVWLEENDNPKNVTAFEKAWDDLDRRLNITSILLRADILSQLSTYSVVLIGSQDGALDQELPRGKPEKLIGLWPFAGGGGPGTQNRGAIATLDGDATIASFEDDPHNPRFGLPRAYNLRRTDINNPDFQKEVHWSRIIHIAEGCLDNDVYGQPCLERVWNLLDDLDKVTGGGSEAHWLRANQGMHLNVDKSMGDMSDSERASLQTQADEYAHQMRRMFRTRGVDINTLGSDVSDFGGNADAILTQIAGAKRIPKRILTGSEMGELASSQDRENWKDQIVGRQNAYAGPYIVRQLADRLIKYGYLPPSETYIVKWSTIQTLTSEERAQGAQKWAAVNRTQGSTVFTTAETRSHWYDFEPLKEDEIELVPPAPPPAPEKEIDGDERFPRAAADPRIRAAAEGTKFSSTQVNLPRVIGEKLLKYALSIPREDLADDGVELQPHVTVKYGIHTNDAAAVRAALGGHPGPVRLALGNLAFFSAPVYDVVYVEVKSADLEDLNKRLADRLEVTDTHPTYVPHATLAYVKPGLGQKYTAYDHNDDLFSGLNASVGSIVFSPAEGEDVEIDLAMRADTEAYDDELVRVLEEAIKVNNTEVIDRIIGVNRMLGGPGSGNFGHEGRPGEVGGSAPSAAAERINEIDRKIMEISSRGGGNSAKEIKARMREIEPLIAEQERLKNELEPTRKEAIAASAKLVKRDDGGYSVQHSGQTIGTLEPVTYTGFKTVHGAQQMRSQEGFNAVYEGNTVASQVGRKQATEAIARAHSDKLKGSR